jgi:hypothetical protein
MQKSLYPIVFVLLMMLSSAASSAGISVGKVLAFDREAQRLVLTDRSIWSLAAASQSLPDELSAGDRVQFSYRDTDNDVGEIIEINVMREFTEQGVRVSASGTVLAFDRVAQLLVLEDKSAWSLANMQNTLPIGIAVGNRVRIEYESAEDGSRLVREVRVITR